MVVGIRERFNLVAEPFHSLVFVHVFLNHRFKFLVVSHLRREVLFYAHLSLTPEYQLF